MARGQWLPPALPRVRLWTALEEVTRRAREKAGKLEGFVCCVVPLRRHV